MRLTKPENINYCASVVNVKTTIPLENCDNVVGINVFGFQCIVSKDIELPTLGIFFPAEVQLSEEYCRENNLFRHEDQNEDKSKKGYIEDNRRVKAMKFRKQTSNGLFMPLESLNYLGIDISEFDEGDEFDMIGDSEICKKYVVPHKQGNYVPLQKKERRVEEKFLPEHFSTEHYFRNDRNIDPDQEIIVTQKIHGTSIRIANTIVKRKKTLRDRIAAFFGANIQEYEYDYVFGSRKVIKDANNPDQMHFYDFDLWSSEGKKLMGLIPENFILYGELIGHTPEGKPIQRGYTYNVPEKLCELYIYRITFVNAKGLATDLSWDQIKEFATARGLKLIKEVYRGKHKDFKATDYLDIRLKDKFPECLVLDKDTVDEGICIRVEKLTPQIYKAKSPKFLEHESTLMDLGEEDMENDLTPAL